MSEVADRVREITAKHLNVEESKVTPNASFINDLNADSLDTVELLMALEDEFGLEIPQHDADKIHTVGEVIDYIKKHKAA